MNLVTFPYNTILHFHPSMKTTFSQQHVYFYISLSLSDTENPLSPSKTLCGISAGSPQSEPPPLCLPSAPSGSPHNCVNVQKTERKSKKTWSKR